jgi:preprotein translocase subunit YajC
MSTQILAMQAPGGLGLLGGALPFIFLFAVLYFVMILPQQRRQKKWTAMLEAVKTGDRVVTSGGLRGTVVSIKDDALQLRVPPDNLRLEVTKASVVSVTTTDDEAKVKAS